MNRRGWLRCRTAGFSARRGGFSEGLDFLVGGEMGEDGGR